MTRRQLQRWEFVCDGHYQNGVDCPVAVILDAEDVVDATARVGMQGWQEKSGLWLCGYKWHRENLDERAADPSPRVDSPPPSTTHDSYKRHGIKGITPW